MRKLFHCRQNQVTQERRTGVFAGTGRSLNDHRTIGLVRRLHNGAHLLQVVHVESRHAVTEFGRVVQQLSHANQSHFLTLLSNMCTVRAYSPRSSSTATAGSFLPSTNSRKAPPPVEM